MSNNELKIGQSFVAVKKDGPFEYGSVLRVSEAFLDDDGRITHVFLVLLFGKSYDYTASGEAVLKRGRAPVYVLDLSSDPKEADSPALIEKALRLTHVPDLDVKGREALFVEGYTGHAAAILDEL